ncbi:hypothetical protein RSOLAG22IIIB_07209 [Rhizoctonia solani]|uniref:Uncharacterized protein n=1 Tax=Rhizoctonia solani TaxID=456999 RepID=A0A0K6FLI5_9AGAM|nr:hypothetical protein RSOLAG22IIIB_07209 [Rhizoctonia solani]
MGRNLAYPADVSAARIREIHQQSQSNTIYAYGFLLSPFTSPINPNLTGKTVPYTLTDSRALRMLLCAAGLSVMALVIYPIPESDGEDEAFMVVLETGFGKELHCPVPDEVLLCVQNILNTTQSPSWWRMEGFRYPPPQLTIKNRRLLG